MFDNKVVDNVANGVGCLISIPRMIVSILLLLIGSFMLFVTVGSMYYSTYYIETTAKVVDIHYDAEMKKYNPVYEFRYKGETVTVNGMPYTDSPDEIVIGEKTVISYDPDDYKNFDIGTQKDTKILFVLGLFFVITSGGFLYGLYKTFKQYIKMKKNNNIEIQQH